jgi:hypothetical protein
MSVTAESSLSAKGKGKGKEVGGDLIPLESWDYYIRSDADLQAISFNDLCEPRNVRIFPAILDR